MVQKKMNNIVETHFVGLNALVGLAGRRTPTVEENTVLPTRNFQQLPRQHLSTRRSVQQSNTIVYIYIYSFGLFSYDLLTLFTYLKASLQSDEINVFDIWGKCLDIHVGSVLQQCALHGPRSNENFNIRGRAGMCIFKIG